MSEKIGRNDPCPCGSGKKFKKCCGANRDRNPDFFPAKYRTGTAIDEFNVLLPFLALHEAKIIRFEQDGPEYKKIRRGAEKRLRPGSEDGVLDSHFMSWLYLDLRFGRSGRTIAERVLADPMTARLNEPGPSNIRLLAESYASYYEVLESFPDLVVLSELGTGRTWRAEWPRRAFDMDPGKGDIWYTRLLGSPDDALCFTTPYVYDPPTREQFERATRRIAADFAKDPRSIGIPRERLFAESQKGSTPLWHDYIRISQTTTEETRRAMMSSVPHEWPSSLMPRMINTDREDLCFTEMHFRVKDEKAVRKKLSALKSFDRDEKDDSCVWLKSKSRNFPDEPRTVLGNLRFKEGSLVAETNSRERAARLEDKLHGHFGSLIFLESTSFKRLEDMPPLPPEEREASRRESEKLNAEPEVREALRRSRENYYFRRWPRQKIPALGNITPLQAARTEKGRKKLEDLLEYIERLQDADDQPKIDLNKLREMLGLFRKG